MWEVSDVSTILVREGSQVKQHLGLLLDELTQDCKQIPSGRARQHLGWGSAPAETRSRCFKISVLRDTVLCQANVHSPCEKQMRKLRVDQCSHLPGYTSQAPSLQSHLS